MTPAPSPPGMSNAYLPTRQHTVVVAAFALGLSWLLQRVSGSSYLDVASHIGFIAAVLLLAYSAAGSPAAARRRPRWMAPGLARVVAVVLAAPVAALLTTLVAQGSGVLVYLRQPQGRMAQTAMVVLALFFGVLFALVGLRGERRQRERADRLQAELDKNRLERELQDARLHLLRAQIEPHFLFNTLANVEALVASGSGNAAPVLRHLIVYLRAAMPRLSDANATLDTELQLVRAYLELMRLRMPDRLRYAVAAPALAATLRFPPMALLTLVENAVRHGIDPSVDGGAIEVGADCDDAAGIVTLWVADTGCGMAETAQPGTGLSNLRARLEGCYGPGARVDLHEVAPHGLRVELRFQPGAGA
jgi:LytS/YehU family sensor histidine kinase